MCIGCGAVAAQQETASPATSGSQTSESALAQPEFPPGQDQNTDGAKSQTDTKTPPQAEHLKKQRSASVANPNTRRQSVPKRAAVPSAGAPKKVVVREGGAEEPIAQIVTNMTAEESDRQRRVAELLLSTTAETLKEIAPRALDSQEQETVSQIQNYMEGSRSAMKEGDVPRAHTLALKAGLLADDLSRH
jgi:hypothetical protein